jgi:hypothetical protein
LNMPLRIFRSNDERIVSIFMVRTSVGVHTRRALWSTWRTVAPVGAWVNSVGETDAVDYGAGAPWRAEELLLTILMPGLRVGFSGGDHTGAVPVVARAAASMMEGCRRAAARCCFGHRRFLPLLRTTATRVSSVLATSRLQPGVFIASGVDPTRGSSFRVQPKW